jgi:alkyl hydroperoxide reductase subunit AhpC
VCRDLEILTGETQAMSEVTGARLGAPVDDFELETFEPEKGDFGKISLADLKSQGKWSILFFYPADFTFV